MINKGFIAGHTKACIKKWYQITSDPWVLDQIKGVYPDFITEPRQLILPNEISWSTTEFKIIDKEVVKLLEKNIIKLIKKHEQDQFISNIFFRYKSNMKIRIILNLKPLNKWVHYKHFKMSSLKDAIHLMTRNCFFTSIDLQDAYYSIPVHEKATKYFRFYHNGQLYEFQNLVMGFSESPRIFTKITIPMLSTLREDNIQIMMYIDDALIVNKNKQQCDSDTMKACTLMQELGFCISLHKSELKPRRIITYLGFILNSETMTVLPTFKKIEHTKSLCLTILNKSIVTIQELSELIGTFVSLIPGNRYGAIFCKRLEIRKNNGLRIHKGDYSKQIKLTNDMTEDIIWWHDNINNYPVLVESSKPELILTSDASGSGWCGIYNTESSEGIWSHEDQEEHINFKELKAALLTLKAYTYDKNNLHIKLFSDNQCTVMCINRKGSCKPHLNTLIRDIWLWCIQHDFDITAIHVPGVDNIADHGSRKHGLETEWCLKQSEFIKIENKYGPFDIDLFASRINKKIDCYVSWHKDHEAFHIDAFTMDWNGLFTYIFPPFSLILRVLQRIEIDQTDCVMIIPWWKSQVWVPKLTQLLIDVPVVLNNSNDLLQHPLMEGPHPILKKSKLLACRLSGISSKSMEFRRKLLTSYPKLGDQTQEKYTPFTYTNGSFIVIQGQRILFQSNQ